MEFEVDAATMKFYDANIEKKRKTESTVIGLVSPFGTFLVHDDHQSAYPKENGGQICPGIYCLNSGVTWLLQKVRHEATKFAIAHHSEHNSAPTVQQMVMYCEKNFEWSGYEDNGGELLIAGLDGDKPQLSVVTRHEDGRVKYRNVRLCACAGSGAKHAREVLTKFKFTPKTKFEEYIHLLKKAFVAAKNGDGVTGGIISITRVTLGGRCKFISNEDIGVLEREVEGVDEALQRKRERRNERRVQSRRRKKARNM